MILAEALANRADVQRRLEQMRGRLAGSALVQEDERPPEEPEELLQETERLLAELEDYIGRINRTNLEATLPDGTTLTAALARRGRARLAVQSAQEPGGRGLRPCSALRGGGDPGFAHRGSRAAATADGRSGAAEAGAGHRYPGR